VRYALLLVMVCGAAAAADGSLSRAEVEQRAPRLAHHFEAIDADGDGRITAFEIRAWRKSRRGRTEPAAARARFDQVFRRADSDGDGVLSRDEAARGLPRLARKFDRIDADGDGRLSLEEVHAWLDTRRRGSLRAGASAK
jgi:Ca2+-binding EF-hand superfamily protein